MRIQRRRPLQGLVEYWKGEVTGLLATRKWPRRENYGELSWSGAKFPNTFRWRLSFSRDALSPSTSKFDLLQSIWEWIDVSLGSCDNKPPGRTTYENSCLERLLIPHASTSGVPYDTVSINFLFVPCRVRCRKLREIYGAVDQDRGRHCTR